MAAIRDHQVVIVAGETGSGKTTQLPKMCLELGRGKKKLIGHTQPRRIAARSVAERIAEELGTPMGSPQARVGYKVRFDDTVSKSTAIKLMTDGVLLNEMQHDRLLRAYDTLIIDEAHERSLNIDFILGFLKQLLPKRPDLKVIITSATIDPESFAEHFADDSGQPAPIIEVSGRTFPVEVRYRPLVETQVNADGSITETDIDPLDGLIAACRELMNDGPGDILCFFSGEREIRDAADALGDELDSSRIDVLPLYGRLSNAEQHRVFHPTPGGKRRIVLATNIAETSLTVPGIHYVVDTGLARISRYSHRTKVQRLPIEEISQASCRQRSGRCGRVANGIAIRLFSEENFDARPEFTDPEILRTHLASVILAMMSLGLGDIEAFPFLQAPKTRSVRDGVNLLTELGALTKQGEDMQLTDIGRDLARIPTDPRLARMLVAAHMEGVLDAVTVIVAALSIQDVRERPTDKQAEADEAHRRFAADSDFIAILNLWNYIQKQRQELSGNQFRKLCHREFLHYVRILEWTDLVRQFLTIVQDLGWSVTRVQHVRDLMIEPESLDENTVARSLLAGLLTHIGMRQGASRQFTGVRNSQFVIHPSSALSNKPPQWVMAAELVETSQVFARTVGPVTPEWVEGIAPQIVKYSYSEPVWSASQGRATVLEKASFLGLPLVVDRRVSAAKVDKALARELFIRHALIEGEWKTRHHFFKKNQQLLAEVSQLEDKARRRDIAVNDDVLFDFYDARLPESIVSSRHFDSWWKKARHKTPDLLTFSFDSLIESSEGSRAAQEFPDVWRAGSLEFELSYVFRPGDPDDGITMRIPLPLLGNIDGQDTRWLVAGMREELVVALIKSLPKSLRRSVVPATDFARRALTMMTPFDGSITHALADSLRRLGGAGISASDFDWSRVPDHVKMQFAAIDRRGKVVAKSRDLTELQESLASTVTQAVAEAVGRSVHSGSMPRPQPRDRRQASGGTRAKGGGSAARKTPPSGGSNLSNVLAQAPTWTTDAIGVVPESLDTVIDGQSVTTYPALVRLSSGDVAMKAFPSRVSADAQQFSFVLNSMIDAVSVSPNQMLKGLGLRERVALEGVPGGVDALMKQLVVLVAKGLLTRLGPVIRDPERGAEVVAAAKAQAAGGVRQATVALAPVLLAVADMRAELEHWDGPSIADMKAQLDFYVGPNAIVRHGIEQLRHVPRYIAAMRARLELLERDPAREAELEDEVQQAFAAFEAAVKRLPQSRAAAPEVKQVRWMIEELRVSVFAQNLGTAQPTSLRRIMKKLDKLR